MYLYSRSSLKQENDMPSRSRVAEFVSYVEAGKYVEAIERIVEERFYYDPAQLRSAS